MKLTIRAEMSSKKIATRTGADGSKSVEYTLHFYSRSNSGLGDDDDAHGYLESSMVVTPEQFAAAEVGKSYTFEINI
jgi:hypothetical protein